MEHISTSSKDYLNRIITSSAKDDPSNVNQHLRNAGDYIEGLIRSGAVTREDGNKMYLYVTEKVYEGTIESIIDKDPEKARGLLEDGSAGSLGLSPVGHEDLSAEANAAIADRNNKRDYTWAVKEFDNNIQKSAHTVELQQKIEAGSIGQKDILREHRAKTINTSQALKLYQKEISVRRDRDRKVVVDAKISRDINNGRRLDRYSPTQIDNHYTRMVGLMRGDGPPVPIQRKAELAALYKYPIRSFISEISQNLQYGNPQDAVQTAGVITYLLKNAPEAVRGFSGRAGLDKKSLAMASLLTVLSYNTNIPPDEAVSRARQQVYHSDDAITHQRILNFNRMGAFRGDELTTSVKTMFGGKGILGFGKKHVTLETANVIRVLVKNAYILTGDVDAAVDMVKHDVATKFGVSEVNRVPRFIDPIETLMFLPPEKIFKNKSPKQLRTQLESEVAKFIPAGIQAGQIRVASDPATTTPGKPISYLVYYTDKYGQQHLLKDRHDIPIRWAPDMNVRSSGGTGVSLAGRPRSSLEGLAGPRYKEYAPTESERRRAEADARRKRLWTEADARRERLQREADARRARLQEEADRRREESYARHEEQYYKMEERRNRRMEEDDRRRRSLQSESDVRRRSLQREADERRRSLEAEYDHRRRSLWGESDARRKYQYYEQDKRREYLQRESDTRRRQLQQEADAIRHSQYSEMERERAQSRYDQRLRQYQRDVRDFAMYQMRASRSRGGGLLGAIFGGGGDSQYRKQYTAFLQREYQGLREEAVALRKYQATDIAVEAGRQVIGPANVPFETKVILQEFFDGALKNGAHISQLIHILSTSYRSRPEQVQATAVHMAKVFNQYAGQEYISLDMSKVGSAGLIPRTGEAYEQPQQFNMPDYEKNAERLQQGQDRRNLAYSQRTGMDSEGVIVGEEAQNLNYQGMSPAQGMRSKSMQNPVTGQRMAISSSQKRVFRHLISSNSNTQSPIDIAKTYLGQDENLNTKTLSDFIRRSSGIKVNPSTTAWCAAFVNAVLGATGQKGTGSLMARSFLKWGTGTNNPVRGDIAVLRRGSSPIYGHVTFFVKSETRNGVAGFIGLGGNQGNKVSKRWYPMSKVISFRSVEGAGPGSPIPVSPSDEDQGGITRGSYGGEGDEQPITHSPQDVIGTQLADGGGYDSEPYDGEYQTSSPQYEPAPIEGMGLDNENGRTGEDSPIEGELATTDQELRGRWRRASIYKDIITPEES